MDFELPRELAGYLVVLDDFIDREITPLEEVTIEARLQPLRQLALGGDVADEEALPRRCGRHSSLTVSVV